MEGDAPLGVLPHPLTPKLGWLGSPLRFQVLSPELQGKLFFFFFGEGAEEGQGEKGEVKEAE